MSISDEAVEAAARCVPGYDPSWDGEELDRAENEAIRSRARQMLEAAAPHMMAAAWGEGLEAGEAGWCLIAIPCGDCANCNSPEPENPYRKTAK